MKPKKNQPKLPTPAVAGLFLWSVRSSAHSESEHYWITTEKDCMQKALAKGKAHLKSIGAFGRRIIQVTARGTLDA